MGTRCYHLPFHFDTTWMVDQKHGGDGMGAVAVDGANGEAVGSVEQMFGRFSAELIHQFSSLAKTIS